MLTYQGHVGLNFGYLTYLTKLFFSFGFIRILTKAPLRLFFDSRTERDVLVVVLLPHGLPNFIKRRLPTPAPLALGDAKLCSLCQNLLTSHKRAGVESSRIFAPDGSSRHHNDRTLLQRSAEAGCQICKHLFDWITGIENKRSGRAFFVFAIRARLQDTDKPDEYELVFSILNFLQPYELTNDNAHHILRLRIICDEGDLDPELSVSDLADTQSSAMLNMIESWISTCEADHKNCRAEYHHREDWLPKRLIDVEDNEMFPPRLCDSSQIPKDTRYLALSHCWGTESITKLLTANHEDFKQALPLSDLQQTFVDAFNLTRRLNVKYLWIDSLCIIQDSISDWGDEALTMGDVYANAFCTIAATGFPDGKNGLFVKRNPDLVPPIRFTVPSNAQPGHGLPNSSYYCVKDIWNEGVVKSPLAQRSWSFQERCLSRRIVHFGPQQVLWECMDTEKCDIFPNALPTTFRTNFKQENAFTKVDLKLRSGLRISAWCDTVNEFTAGSVTREGDKLVAIAGLASKQIWSRPYRYWAGLWDCGFHFYLLWKTSDEANFLGKSKRPKNFRAPSWSWASVDGTIVFLDRYILTKEILWIHEISVTTTSGHTFTETNISTQEYLDKLHNLKASTTTIEPILDRRMFGPLSSAYMRVRGWLALVEFTEPDSVLNIPHTRFGPYNMTVFGQLPSSRNLTIKLILNLDVYAPPQWSFAPSIQNSTDRMTLGSRSFFILPVTEGPLKVKSYPIVVPGPIIMGLILEKTGENRGEYRRLGTFITTYGDKDVDEFLTRSVYRPALDEDDYEGYDSEDGRSTIKLI